MRGGRGFIDNACPFFLQVQDIDQVGYRGLQIVIEDPDKTGLHLIGLIQ